MPEIIGFWRARSERQPLDYLSRTELGHALVAEAAASADLETYAEAEAVLREALRLNPNHHQARLGLASTLVASHNFDSAMAEVGQVLLARPEYRPAIAIDGDARLGVGDVAGAASAYERLVELERSAATVARLARLRSAQGDPDGAVTAATEALQLSRHLDLRPADQAFYHFQLGHFLFASGAAEEAIEAYRTAVGIDPGHPGASEGLAFALASVGRHTEAAQQYRLLLEAGPAADIHGHYAEVLAALGDREGAAEQYRLGDALAMASAEQNPAERRHIARYLANRNPETAIALAKADLEQRQDAGAHDTLAWALHHAGRHDEAAAAIELALATGTGDAGILYHAAAIAEAVGDPEVALANVTAAIERAPDFHPTEAAEARAMLARLAR